MADAVVSFAVERLGDSIFQEVDVLRGVKDEVESLQRELNWMRSFLRDAEQKQDDDQRIRAWVSDIQDIAYDTEDVIETFIFKVKGPIQTSRRGMLSSSVKTCFGISTIPDLRYIGKEIKALKNRVLEVSRMTKTYGIDDVTRDGVQEGTSRAASIVRDLRKTTPNTDEVDVVGFEDDAQSLQERLSLQHPGLGVISILGMGGLGKTTLARKLYNNNRTEFDLHAWVCVSEEWKTRDLFERLIKSFKKGLTNAELKRLGRMENYDMEEHLRDLLEGCKYLVVIDDMWQKEAWQTLRRALPDNQNGSRIIITTRKESVAELSDEPHRLRFLREDESWLLFCKKVFPNNSDPCSPDKESLGKQMVAKCEGLPLAIIVLGGLLLKKQSHEWHVVKERIWRELKNDSTHILSLLTLSYNDLSHELKSCFLYLGLFPEDSIIDVEKLTRMWVAEEFITQEEEGYTIEVVAETYLNELISRSLIQVVHRNWRMVTSCRVHDLLRDLAVSKAKDRNFLHIFNESLNSNPPTVACRRIGFNSDFKSFMSFARLHKRVRTLSNNDFGSEDQRVMKLLSKFRLLRVLDHKGGGGVNGKAKFRFGKVIGKLIHLRYVGLKQFQNKLPESIGNCVALQTLDFGTHVLVLPSTIRRLKQLRHLSGQFHGTPLLFEELTNLQSLKTIDISDWLQQQNGDQLALWAFGKLLHLKVFSVVLGGDYSHLVSVQPLLSCKHLIELRIVGGIINLPEEMHNSLPNLKFLSLTNSRLQRDPVPILEMLPNLVALQLSHVLVRVTTMIFTARGFPQLLFLKLLGLTNETRLQLGEGVMPRLRSLTMTDTQRCTLPERLKSLPGVDDDLLL